MAKDMVNHPQHYGGKDNPYEHIKVFEAMVPINEFSTAMFFQVTKYLWRVGKKSGQPATQDLEKARWYLNRWIVRLGGEDWSPDAKET